MRPFFAYEVSKGGALVTGPKRTFSLFQRAVKKKETHADNDDAEIIQLVDNQFVLPSVLLVLLRRQASWLFSLLFIRVNVNWKRNTVFQVCPSNQYFQLISRLQI
ncbi:hypothetical protein [Pedobacter sp. L105]|uniref:hypothetical protein n=1 Tax=Pedobacter sp. L105 TaxID=1641871 RepID=UPI001C20C421|nr:hypothetical protein [Pedobacter sp. L105]